MTCAPATGLRAADDAVIVREMARAVAHRLGHRAIFSPILDPDGVGNGVHIHMSFAGGAMHDASDKLQLSRIGRAFLGGIVHHMPALCAITAPCPVSYIRLRPNRWAPVEARLANQDRGAAIRICPVLTGGDHESRAAQFNVEYRPADATASPYLALAAIVFAGVDGIVRNRALTDDAHPLPASLGAALDLLEATEAASAWFPDGYLDAYLRHKRAEIGMVAKLDDAQRCALYSEAY